MAINYQKGQTVTEFTPNEYPIFDPNQMAMIGKIAYQIIRGVVANNPLAVFNKMPVNNGDTVEQVIIKLVESEPYDRKGLKAMSPTNKNALAVRYFNTWNEKQFSQTVYYEDLRIVSENVENKTEIASKLVSVLSESDIFENYKEIKGLLKFGATADSTGTSPFVNVGAVATKNGTIDYLGVLTKIKNTVKGMKFVNSAFNSGGVERATEENDIYIIAPYKLLTEIDVESLSGVFNLDKAEIKNRIIEIDEEVDSNGDYTVYVVDQNALQVITRLYIMTNQQNASGVFWNYFLTVSRLYAVSQLYDGTYFKVSTIEPEVQNDTNAIKVSTSRTAQQELKL